MYYGEGQDTIVEPGSGSTWVGTAGDCKRLAVRAHIAQILAHFISVCLCVLRDKTLCNDWVCHVTGRMCIERK